MSWGISRRLGRALLEHFGRYTAILLAFGDLACAVALLGGLAVVLCTTVEALNALALARTGAEVLDLNGLLTRAAAEPFGRGFWITAMLFSTLIPTVLHFGIAVASALTAKSHSRKRTEWLAKIDHIIINEEDPVESFSEIERGKVARYLFWHRAALPLGLAFALTALFILGWDTFIGDISDTLLALANWSRMLVHG